MRERLQQAGVVCTAHQSESSQAQDAWQAPDLAPEQVLVVDALVAESLQHGLLYKREAKSLSQQVSAVERAAEAAQAHGQGATESDSLLMPGIVQVNACPPTVAEVDESAIVAQRHRTRLRQYAAGNLSRHGVLVDLARSKVAQQS